MWLDTLFQSHLLLKCDSELSHMDILSLHDMRKGTISCVIFINTPTADNVCTSHCYWKGKFLKILIVIFHSDLFLLKRSNHESIWLLIHIIVNIVWKDLWGFWGNFWIISQVQWIFFCQWVIFQFSVTSWCMLSLICASSDFMIHVYTITKKWVGIEIGPKQGQFHL